VFVVRSALDDGRHRAIAGGSLEVQDVLRVQLGTDRQRP
jgi:hypothetical protein